MLTGTIEACTDVAGSDKLVQMTVDLGAHGKRTILAGIKKDHAPAELVGKTWIVYYQFKATQNGGNRITRNDACCRRCRWQSAACAIP